MSEVIRESLDNHLIVTNSPNNNLVGQKQPENYDLP